MYRQLVYQPENQQPKTNSLKSHHVDFPCRREVLSHARVVGQATVTVNLSLLSQVNPMSSDPCVSGNGPSIRICHEHLHHVMGGPLSPAPKALLSLRLCCCLGDKGRFKSSLLQHPINFPASSLSLSLMFSASYTHIILYTHSYTHYIHIHTHTITYTLHS